MAQNPTTPNRRPRFSRKVLPSSSFFRAAALQNLVSIHIQTSLPSFLIFIPSLLCKKRIAYTKYTCQALNRNFISCPPEQKKPEGTSSGFLAFRPSARSAAISSFTASTAVRTEELDILVALLIQARGLPLLIPDHVEAGAAAATQSAAATTKRAADSISLALTPSRFQLSHLCLSS